MATRSSSLPAPCEACAGSNDWIHSERGGYTGLGRCHCPRGQMLLAMASRPVPPKRAEPVLLADEIGVAVEALSSIPWFPKEEGARTMIADALARLCSSGQSCFELVRLMVDCYRQWPGVREMRICYCAVIGSPLSGQDLHLAISEFYPDGFGSPVLASARLALPAGHVASVDRAYDDGVRLLAIAKDLNRPKRRPANRTYGAQLPTNPNFKPITQADIDREVSALRDQRARVELGE